MPVWLCRTCGVEHAETPKPPDACAICTDERQYVLPSGQRWTTLDQLAAEGRTGSLEPIEDGLLGVEVAPKVGIGQRGLLVQTADGNLLWDPPGYLDDDLVAAVQAAGGLAAVAASHPHMYGVQVEWSHRFGSVPVWVSAPDREWVQREDPVLQEWDDEVEALPGVRLRRAGGHFVGSSVAHFVGADGQGVLLSGDTVASTPDERWVSFLRSFPNKIPLSAGSVARVVERLADLSFDRLYDNFSGRVTADADGWVRRSADRYTAWVSGANDHLT